MFFFLQIKMLKFILKSKYMGSHPFPKCMHLLLPMDDVTHSFHMYSFTNCLPPVYDPLVLSLCSSLSIANFASLKSSCCLDSLRPQWFPGFLVFLSPQPWPCEHGQNPCAKYLSLAGPHQDCTTAIPCCLCFPLVSATTTCVRKRSPCSVPWHCLGEQDLPQSALCLAMRTLHDSAVYVGVGQHVERESVLRHTIFYHSMWTSPYYSKP